MPGGGGYGDPHKRPAEKVRIEARRAGHAVTEQPLADGIIKLTVQVVQAGAGIGGAA